ncbi:MAG: hypothetical protein KIC77_02855 [Clostridiales bacterium]|nr:hypothetical protein [Clostridiales bacterium]
MEICNAQYKNKQGIKIRTSALECIILPKEGGKMISLRERESGEELLAQAEGKIYKDLTFNGSYVDSECSAFDDLFPTIDPWYNGDREYADHGEVCRLPNAYTIIKDGELSLHMSVLSPFGDYIFRKIYKEQDGGIEITYEAENIGEKPLKAIWASHLMLKAQEGETVMLEEDKEYEAEFMFCEDAEIAQRGTMTKLKNGCELLQSKPYSETGNAYKFYIKKPYRGEFRYGKITIRTENANYLGIWINNGCFKGMYNVAAEFCTGAYDTPGAAEANGANVTIPAGETLKWKLFLSVHK